MFTLTSVQRRLLETTVIKARQLSEQGAEKALKNLAADQPEPFSHMDAEQRDLRRRLRAKARLLGDENTNGKQEIRQLSYELAYEYWHKMLFARFLETNNLLIHPEHNISVSLEECAEFAPEEGHADKWAAAAYYASNMLPAIFRPEDPLTQVDFATEDRLSLEALLEGIGTDIFLAGDSLGWVYQYWQTERKKEIEEEEKSGKKIDGERIGAKTQLFTEPYMVHFLIDNTIGAWWVGRNPGKTPPVIFEYLRTLDDGSPAAGNFEGWPDATNEVTCLDPCMGSGHFIVELFLVLAPLRMLEEGLNKDQTTIRVIIENLHGLEIDPRCTQIAAFNLALTAWKFCGKYIELPEMNLACSGVAPKGKKEDWVKLVSHERDIAQRARMEKGMEVLYEHFQLAPELGSLLDPTTIKADMFTAKFDELQPALMDALSVEQDKDIVERGVMAAGIAKAGLLLSKKYTLQITNVPYLSRGKQDKVMTEYASDNYPEAKGDLATVFFDSMLRSSRGTACSVIPQNWLFLTSYKKFRIKLLKNHSWSVVARLGSKGFQTPMWDFNIMLISIHHSKPHLDTLFPGLDVSERPNAAAKDEALKTTELKTVNQKEQLGNPDARVVLDSLTSIKLLSEYALGLQGISPADLSQFGRYIWEIMKKNEFVYWQSTIQTTSYYGGRDLLLWWSDNLQLAYKAGKAYIRGSEAWGKLGIVVSQVGNLPVSLYTGEKFDTNCAIISPKNSSDSQIIWCFCSSPEYNMEVRKIDQKLNVTNATLVKVPFDLEHWQKVAAEKYPYGLPKPYSDDPTQWLFHGHPKHTDNPLQVIVGRLMGYRWPAESDEEMELDQKARDHIAQIRVFDNLTDDDGILCIPPVNGERPAAECLREYIKEVWQDDWGHNTLIELLRKEGATKSNLEQWLREEFFIQHCKVFSNRPFIWHIWDGRKDGFAALVNYHKLNNANLQKLIYTYLNDWIRQCDRKDKDGESGADGLLIAAHQLKQKLELILAGDPPYDIFVRWKPGHEQPIGWDPDINDGVRLNIYPFMQASILRKNPNIKWDKDRGKNPEGSPWGLARYNRYEDLDDKYKLKDESGKVVAHLTNEVKRKAREKNHKSI